MMSSQNSGMQKFITLAKKGRCRPVYYYTISFFSTLFTFLLAAYFIYLIHDFNPFIFFILTISLNTWYGGRKAGFFTLLLSIIGIGILISLPGPLFHYLPALSLLVHITLYIIIGVLLSFIIDAAKRSKKIVAYEKLLEDYKKEVLNLKQNYAKAQEEIKARDEFLAVASHELKTPVTSMILQVQTALHNIRNVSLAKFSVSNLLHMLDSTEQQSKRLAKMVNDLLNTSLITTGRLDLELEDVDLSQMVKDVSLQFSEKLKKENYDLIIKAEKPIVGKFDKLRIGQVISNLLSNAIKYGNKKPIRLVVTNSNSRGTITIKDEGIGIPREQQVRIFKRFARAVNGNEYRGLGVGLYITDQIVKAHNGKILLESKPGRGTTFTIDLPLTANLRSN